MPTTKNVTLYQFNELGYSAKEKAREWFRTFLSEDNYNYEYLSEQFKGMMEIFGCKVDHTYYSGFSSQGDGASFTGYWSYNKGWRKAFTNPETKQVYDFAKPYMECFDAITKASRKNFYQVNASITHSGHYQHSGCMHVSVNHEDYSMDLAKGVDDDITDNFRYIADTFYEFLEKAYEWQNADVQVDENIICNEYTFTSEGKRED